MLKLNDEHRKILSLSGHMLITGGPGCGKTTISILKAAGIAANDLRPGQHVLFLSFARATVSRVIEAIEREHTIESSLKKRIRVETYHASFWQILKTHGYLVGLPRRLSILLPQQEAIALSAIRNGYGPVKNLDDSAKAEKHRDEQQEQTRLAYEEGRVCFDLFAHFVNDILQRSTRIRQLVSLMFPYIILDEFQDTNAEQWNVVKWLCESSVAIALADPEQRIYDWIGADPERLEHFRSHCTPEEIDLGDANHRSTNTEILAFADDVLRRRFRKQTYEGVSFSCFKCNQNQALTAVVTHALQARGRLFKAGVTDWSLAILTPTKRLTRQVSDALRSPPARLSTVRHTAAVDVEGVILSAELIASLLEPSSPEGQIQKCVEMLCRYYRGKGGDSPSKTALEEAERISRAYKDYAARVAKGDKIRANSLLVPMMATLEQVRALLLSGDPSTDWLAVRKTLDDSKCKRLREVGEEARNVRLLDRGTQLRQSLSQDWRDNGCYRNALEITSQAFVQEHFAMAGRPENGVVVMNMHKAKGKQCDEVIIFEGWPRISRNTIVSNPDRIVRGNSIENAGSHSRQNFRVSITRAKQRVTILTPEYDPCILLTSARSGVH